MLPVKVMSLAENDPVHPTSPYPVMVKLADGRVILIHITFDPPPEFPLVTANVKVLGEETVTLVGETLAVQELTAASTLPAVQLLGSTSNNPTTNKTTILGITFILSSLEGSVKKGGDRRCLGKHE